MPTSTSGCLLIADITGYTMFLSESELEHAQETLSTLLEVLIEHTRSPLIISRLAGDAVISYALQETSIQGQTLVEMIEDTYLAFRKAIDLMVMNNTCQCNACANVSNLDVKFFVHHGTFALQRLSAHVELVGNDVNLIHRLLKNTVTEKTGCRAYTLYTDAVIQSMGLGDMSATMIRHSESYEHLGEVQVWIQDMHPVWEQKKNTTQIIIPPDTIVCHEEIDIAMPPEMVWDYLARPEFRAIFTGSERMEIHHRTQGRVAPETVFQCFHGDKIIPMTILAWQPFERMLVQSVGVIPNTYCLVDTRLYPTETGTRLTDTMGKITGPWLRRMLTRMIGPMISRVVREQIRAFKQAIEDDLAAQGGVPKPTATFSPEMIGEAAAEGLANP